MLQLPAKDWDRTALEVIREFQCYGWEVIGRRRPNYTVTEEFSPGALAELQEQSAIPREAPCIWLSRTIFEREVKKLSSAGHPQAHLFLQSWLIRFDGNPSGSEPLGTKLAQRLKAGEAVTLTPLTAAALAAAWSAEPPAYYSSLLWAVVWCRLWTVRLLRRQVRIHVRPENDSRAGIWNLTAIPVRRLFARW